MAIAILAPAVEPSAPSARLTRWLRREGDFVEAGDPVAELATARATMDVEAPASGVLTRILIAAGEAEIAAGSEIGVIVPGPARHLALDASGARQGGGRVARILASPRAKRLAAEAGVDLSRLSVGAARGRIVEADVRAALAFCPGDDAPGERRPSSALAGRLHPLLEAAQWTPQVHLEADCHIDALEIFRAERNEQARAAHQTRIALLDCVVKALAGALRQTPRANVARTAKGYEPARRADIALGLTLDGEIVAPALPGVEDMPLGEIAAARAAFLAGRFSPRAFAGGASLVANLGAFGVKRGFPVLMAPWTSVLAMGAAEKKLVVEQGAPAIATVLPVTLSIDRRAMDEAVAGALLAAFKGLMEHPAGLVD